MGTFGTGGRMWDGESITYTEMGRDELGTLERKMQDVQGKEDNANDV